MNSMFVALLCMLNLQLAGAGQLVEFSDRVALVKESSVAFEKHAASYKLDAKLLRAAREALKSGREVEVTVDAEELRVLKLKVAAKTRRAAK